MAPKLDIIYSRVWSKFVAPSRQMIGISNDERDLENVLPSINTLTSTARECRGTLRRWILT